MMRRRNTGVAVWTCLGALAGCGSDDGAQAVSPAADTSHRVSTPRVDPAPASLTAPAIGIGGVGGRIDISGLSDFDFTRERLAVRIGQSFHTCELPGCSRLVPVPNVSAREGRFAIAGDRLFLSMRPRGTLEDNIFSVAFDGSNLENRSNFVPPGARDGSVLTVTSFAGGPSGVEQIVRWARYGEAGYRTLVESASGLSANTYRVGRATANVHENLGALVRYFPPQMRLERSEQNPARKVTPASMAINTVSLPLPATNPLAIATSQRGSTTAFPMVVIREGGTLKACPTATPCMAWIDLGNIGNVFAIGRRYLFVGNSEGLSTCPLEEIATKRTCTLAPLAPREVVQAPLYLTDNQVVFKSGPRVRAVFRPLQKRCAVGEGVTGDGLCEACGVGQEPSVAGTCVPCPRGTYSQKAGARMCVACPRGSSTSTTGNTSSASCTPCADGETASARTFHLCAPIPPRRVFVTAETHSGDFANDPALSGASGIARADAFCMSSLSRPPTGTYKAMLVDGVTRDAAERLDWVFLPSTPYVQVDGSTLVGTTNDAGLLDLPLRNAWEGDVARSEALFWTGIDSAGWSGGAATSCGQWGSKDPSVVGHIGAAGQVNATAIGVGSAAVCSMRLSVLCVEQ
jgi:hypothetical protein